MYFQKQQSSEKYKTNALRLNNNSLSDFNGFESTIEKLLENPGQLSWLDLSFNYLTSIDKVSFIGAILCSILLYLYFYTSVFILQLYFNISKYWRNSILL